MAEDHALRGNCLRFTLLRLAVWGVAIVVLSACGPTIQGEYRSDGFNKKRLAVSGLIVGGAVSAIEEQSALQRSRWAEWLTASFREEHTFAVQSAAYLHAKMGDEAYQTMLNHYRLYGDIKSADVAFIRDVLPEIQYVAFARLLSNEASQYREEKVEELEAGDEKDKKFHAEPIKIHTYYNTIRTVDVSLLIYDLHHAEAAWSGIVEMSDVNTNQYTEILLEDDDWNPMHLVGDIVLGVVNDNHSGFTVGDCSDGMIAEVRVGPR